MTEREVLKLALDALDLLAKYENPSTKIQVRKPRDGGPIVTMYPHKVATDAAALLRERLAQPEQEPVVWMYQDKTSHAVKFQRHMSNFVDHSKTSEIPLYSEPLANHELQCVCGAVWCGDEMVHLPNKIPPQPEQEPVAWYATEHGEADTIWSSQRPPWEGNWKPLYTTPPHRKKD